MGVGFYRDRTLRLDHPISLHPFLQRRISQRSNDIGCNGWLRIEFVDPASARIVSTCETTSDPN